MSLYDPRNRKEVFYRGILDQTPQTLPDPQTREEIYLKAIAEHTSQYYGSPLAAATVADMTETDRVYVYTGTEVGYTAGNWYFYDGSSWVSGGVYNAVVVTTDPTLTEAGEPADAAATGDIFRDITDYVEPVNMFNKDSTLIKTNYKVAYSGGYSSLSGSSVTHPIPIEVGETYSFKFSGSYYGDTANSIVRYCKADGTLGDGGYANVLSDSGGTHYGSFEAYDHGEEYRYVCVNVRSTLLGSFMFVKGATIPAYSGYFDPYYIIKDTAMPSVDHNPLYGKKAAFTGDSICYGVGYAGGYAGIIGTDNGMGISNTAKTGATLATGTTSGGVDRYWISNLVGQMPAGYDYYIVEGGVNDADTGLGVQLGSLSSGYTATLDTTTLYGAVETICKTLQTTFAGKKIGFIIPHNCYPQTHRWNTEFRPAIKEACEKWGVPYLDLSELVPQLYNLTALRVYTDNNDGWHPNEQGYKLFYVPKIEAWMKTL